GSYEAYCAEEKARQTPPPPPVTLRKVESKSAMTRAEKQEDARRKSRAKEIEKLIETLEEEEAALTEALARPEVAADYKKLSEVCKQLEEVKTRTEALYAEYETLI
ncbi:MAG: hypothetical protein ACI4U2_01960, partial [Christensenellaceae bacterium]